MRGDEDILDEIGIDEDILTLMKDYDIDQENAEQVRDAMEEFNVDEDDAIQLVDERTTN